jgi:hypothetical protein
LFREQVFAGNAFLATRPAGVASPEGVPFLYTRLLSEMDSIRGHSYHFPIQLRAAATGKNGGRDLLSVGKPRANLSKAARAYLATLGIRDPDADAETAGLIWMHALAIGYSPAYLAENADGIRRDWPRIPLPHSREALDASAELGRRMAALLDTESDVRGVTAGRIEPLFRTIGTLCRVGGGSLNPDAGDLAVTAGWGHAGKGGVTMPAKGRIVERPYDEAERAAIAEAAQAGGLPLDQALAVLGTNTGDVYLSSIAYWKNVPANVWEYYIGGYQVVKKWLSYREQELLGRPLRAEEAREVMNMARRLAAILLMQPALDENYRQVKAATYAWPTNVD